MREDLARLTQLAGERGATSILIGNPVRMNGLEGAGSAWVREFAERLEKHSGFQVLLWDERLTTVEAGRVLRESGISREKRARAVDRLAAVILLQSYLESRSAAGESGDQGG